MSAINRPSSGGAASPATLYSVEASLSQAQVNSGTVMLAAADGVEVVLVGYYIRLLGTWSPGSDISIADTAGNPLFTLDDSLSTNQSYTEENSGSGVSNAQLQSFPATLTSGRGLKIIATGTWTGGGTAKVRLLYRLQ
jgi:hypothetical protein